jgi:RecA-family ATPase
MIVAPGAKGLLAPTPELAKFEALMIAKKPVLTVVDSTADFYGANEIDRAQVRGFVTLLRSLAIKADSAILLLIHPSVDGIKSGRGYSGSTHWNNSVRSRMYMTVPGSEDGEEQDPDRRVLELIKANRGRRGQKIWMRFNDGIFEQDARSVDSPEAFESQIACEDQLLKIIGKINRSGREVSPYTGKNYAPAMAAKHPENSGFKAKEFDRAMEILLGSGKLKVATYGPPSKQRSRLEIMA